MSVIVEELNGEGLDRAVQAGERIFVDYYSPNCGPCRMLSRILDDIATRIDSVPMYRVDFEANPDAVKKYDIPGFPTMVVYENGAEVQRLRGLQQMSVIEKMVRGSDS